MSRHYSEVTPAPGPYAAQPSLTILFEPDEWRFHPLSAAANDVAYSFDGINDHGKVFGGSAVNSFIPERGSETKVWLRILAGTPTVGLSARTDPR